MTTRFLTLAAGAALALAACAPKENATPADSAAGASSAATTPTPAPGATAGDTTAATASGGAVATSGGLVDPNSASKEQIAGLPGMTPQLADSLVAKRPFQDMRAVDKLLADAKLTEQQRDTIYARMFKPLDLNSATKEEIELIPGVGARMRHEFEEYRPYRNIEQFRREIGKYVDKNEVARLERYVTIRQ